MTPWGIKPTTSLSSTSAANHRTERPHMNYTASRLYLRTLYCGIFLLHVIFYTCTVAYIFLKIWTHLENTQKIFWRNVNKIWNSKIVFEKTEQNLKDNFFLKFIKTFKHILITFCKTSSMEPGLCNTTLHTWAPVFKSSRSHTDYI